jgi:hypothetical protein
MNKNQAQATNQNRVSGMNSDQLKELSAMAISEAVKVNGSTRIISNI